MDAVEHVHSFELRRKNRGQPFDIGDTSTKLANGLGKALRIPRPQTGCFCLQLTQEVRPRDVFDQRLSDYGSRPLPFVLELEAQQP